MKNKFNRLLTACSVSMILALGCFTHAGAQTIPTQIESQLPPGAAAFDPAGLSFTNVTYKAAFGTEILAAGTMTYAQVDEDLFKIKSFDIGLGQELTLSTSGNGLHSASLDIEVIKNLSNWQLVGKAGYGRNFEDNVANYLKLGFDVNYNLTAGGMSFLGTKSGGFTYVGAGVSWANQNFSFKSDKTEKMFRLYVGYAF